MKYDYVIEKQLGKLTSLQKVRVKVDPKYFTQEADLSQCGSYEGYVLEENLTRVKVLILPPDLTIADIPVEFIEKIIDDDKIQVFEELKAFLIQKLECNEGDPIVQQIFNCQDITEIEAFVKEKGVNDDKLLEIYKEFILI